MKKAIFTAALLLLSLLSWGQRTSVGTKAASLRGGYTGGGVCAEAMFTRFTLNGFYELGLSYRGYSKPTSIDVDMPYCDISLDGSLDWRIAGDYTHQFNCYLGAGIFLGYRVYDMGGALPDDAYTGLKGSDFTYGVFPQAEMEYYVGPKVAILLSGKAPLNIVSEIKSQVHFQGTLGVRYSF